MIKLHFITLFLFFCSIKTYAQVDLENHEFIRSKTKDGLTTRIFGLNNQDWLYIGSVEHPISNIYFYNKSVGDVMSLRDNGNVGIGTVNPNSRLTVYGETGIELRKTGNVEQFMQIRPMIDVENLNPGGSRAAAQITNLNLQHLVLDIKANDSQDSFAIRTDSNYDGEVDLISMVVKPSGNVGIGTTAPGQTSC